MKTILGLLGGTYGLYILAAVGACFAGVAAWGGVQKWERHTVETEYAKHLAADAQANVDALDKARQLEQNHAAELAAADHKHQEDLDHERKEADRLIAAERSGALKLRERFRGCAAGSGTSPAGAAGLGHAPAPTGLQGSDVEDFVRLADDADSVVLQLTEAQRVIRSQIKTCNGMAR